MILFLTLVLRLVLGSNNIAAAPFIQQEIKTNILIQFLTVVWSIKSTEKDSVVSAALSKMKLLLNFYETSIRDFCLIIFIINLYVHLNETTNTTHR